MRKTLSLLGVLMLVAVSAQAQQPTQPTKTKTSTTKAPVSKASNPKTATSKGDSALMNRSDAKPVDVNTATRAELIDAGWGEYADGIIAHRPYTTVGELADRNIVPRTAFDEGSTRFNVGSQDGDSPMQNQSMPAADTNRTGVSSGAPTDSTRAATAVPGSTSPAKDSTASPSR